jgi:signal transduction histidine kinase
MAGMEMEGKTGSAPSRSLPEAMGRMLRHEVGDLLQTVYATVAILQKRLPADWSQERRILTDLRNRGEGCKRLLDQVHDYVCPVTLTLELLDPVELTTSLASAAAPRFPQLEIQVQTAPTPPILADEHWLPRAINLLLTNACEAARRQVQLRIGPRTDRPEVEWTLLDDGPGASPAEVGRLFEPFFTTRHGHAGLGMALAQKIVVQHGGRIIAANVPEGGFRAQLLLPQAGPELAGRGAPPHH